MRADSQAKEGPSITYKTEVQKAKSLQAYKNTLIKGAVHKRSHKDNLDFSMINDKFGGMQATLDLGISCLSSKIYRELGQLGLLSYTRPFVRSAFPLPFHKQRGVYRNPRKVPQRITAQKVCCALNVVSSVFQSAWGQAFMKT